MNVYSLENCNVIHTITLDTQYKTSNRICNELHCFIEFYASVSQSRLLRKVDKKRGKICRICRKCKFSSTKTWEYHIAGRCEGDIVERGKFMWPSGQQTERWRPWCPPHGVKHCLWTARRLVTSTASNKRNTEITEKISWEIWAITLCCCNIV